MVLLASPLVRTAHAGAVSGSMTTDNAFFLYISTSVSTLGTLVETENNWPDVLSFSNFPLTSGVTNYLHIEAINYGGPAGVIGQFTLSDASFEFANGTQTLITDTTDWSGFYNDSNSNPSTAQPWVATTAGVTSLGANGVGPWGNMGGISASADWIWANDSNSLPGGVCGDCTIDLSTPIFSEVSPAPEPGTLGLVGGALIAVGLIRRRKPV